MCVFQLKCQKISFECSIGNSISASHLTRSSETFHQIYNFVFPFGKCRPGTRAALGALHTHTPKHYDLCRKAFHCFTAGGSVQKFMFWWLTRRTLFWPVGPPLYPYYPVTAKNEFLRFWNKQRVCSTHVLEGVWQGGQMVKNAPSTRC